MATYRHSLLWSHLQKNQYCTIILMSENDRKSLVWKYYSQCTAKLHPQFYTNIIYDHAKTGVFMNTIKLYYSIIYRYYLSNFPVYSAVVWILFRWLKIGHLQHDPNSNSNIFIDYAYMPYTFIVLITKKIT